MTPKQLILNKLTQNKNEFVALIDLHHISGGKPVQRAIQELLNDGHRIELKTTKVGRMTHTSYRLNLDENQMDLL